MTAAVGLPAGIRRLSGRGVTVAVRGEAVSVARPAGVPLDTRDRARAGGVEGGPPCEPERDVA